MRIAVCASEGAPYCKSGGLGDVMEALPAALSRIEGRPVRQVSIRSVQAALLDAGCYIMPYLEEKLHRKMRFIFVSNGKAR